MSTKRTLLHESRQTLQNQYANSLTQENKASQITENDYNSNQLEMIPIIGGGGSTNNNQTTIIRREPSTNIFNLIHCQGWVRSGRIWIQVAAK